MKHLQFYFSKLNRLPKDINCLSGSPKRLGIGTNSANYLATQFYYKHLYLFHFKRCKHCQATKITFDIETSGGKNSSPYLNLALTLGYLYFIRNKPLM